MSSSLFADAIVVAAGTSRRMGGLDKLSVDLAGRPLLRWSVAAMRAATTVADVIVVGPQDRLGEMAEQPWLRELGARVVGGGERRQDSVAAGVRAARGDVVLVHDGARPLVTPALVDAVALAAARDGAAIPVLPVADSLKQLHGRIVAGPAPRDAVYRAQTPQGARRDVLRAAVDALAAGPETFGDEAELLARYGVTVTTVPGEAANIKVTHPDDLAMARAIASARHAGSTQEAASARGSASMQEAELRGRPVRYATGIDSHPFGPTDGLRLGGIEIPEAPRLAGHSDGDAALHAICDALLGAAAQGDLGRLFPPGDPATRGIDSRELLASVVARLSESGIRPVSIDLTIVGARPRLGAARLERMRAAIAELVGLPICSVSAKAASGNLSGPEGAGRVIAAAALVGVSVP